MSLFDSHSALRYFPSMFSRFFFVSPRDAPSTLLSFAFSRIKRCVVLWCVACVCVCVCPCVYVCLELICEQVKQHASWTGVIFATLVLMARMLHLGGNKNVMILLLAPFSQCAFFLCWLFDQKIKKYRYGEIIVLQ